MQIQLKKIIYNCIYSKTCFLGFISGIKSLRSMVPDLLQEQPFILTYRFSQDHLELFFNAVRKAGEFST